MNEVKTENNCSPEDVAFEIERKEIEELLMKQEDGVAKIRAKHQHQIDKQKVVDGSQYQQLMYEAGITIFSRTYGKYIVDGLPITVVVIATPKIAYARYKSRVEAANRLNKTSATTDINAVNKAIEEAADSSVFWPDIETFHKMCNEYPELKSSAGALGISLRLQEEEKTGK
jgi:hypothetical protein